MNDEDFACDKFMPQKWRKDVCRSCFQPQRLHEKKHRKPTVKSAEKKEGSEATNANTSPKPEPKVFKRYRQQRDTGVDTSVPARERTQPQQLEGIQPGTIKKVLGVAPTLKVDSEKFQEFMQQANPSHGAGEQASSNPQASSASPQADTSTASPQDVSLSTASPQAVSISTASPQTDTSTASPQDVSLSTASPQAVSISTASPQADTGTASPQAVSISTASPQADTSTTSPQAVSISTASPQAVSLSTASPQAVSISTANPQAVSLSTASPQAVSLSTASPQAVSLSTTSPQADTSTASPQAVSISTASPQADTSTASPQAVSISTASPQADTSTASPQAVSINTASPQAVSISTASPQADTSTASPQAVSISTASPQADTSTASPQAVSINTASPQAVSLSTVSPQAVSISTASPQADTSTASPPAVSINTATPPEATPLSHSGDGEVQDVLGGEVESHEHEQQQPVSESHESSATQQLHPSESAVISENQDTELASPDPTVTAGVTESSQLNQDHSTTESFPDNRIIEAQDKNTGITESPHDPSITESSQGQPQPDDANANADSQIQSEVRDDVMQGSDHFGSETASQEVENQVTLKPSEEDLEVKREQALGTATELTEKGTQETTTQGPQELVSELNENETHETPAQPNVELSEKPQELVSELTESNTQETATQPNVELSEKPQELVSELNENDTQETGTQPNVELSENAQKAATEVQDACGRGEVLAGEGQMEEGGKEEEVDEVIVSYSPVQDEDNQQSSGDGVLDDRAGGQEVPFDEEPRSKLEGPTVCDEPAAGNSVALTTEEQVQEVVADSFVKPKPVPEEGETFELASGTVEGDRARMGDEDAVVVAGNNAATPDVVPKVTSDGVPLPPLPPGVPPPPPPPPGVEVEEQWPYPSPVPNYVPNDDSIPTPPLPPGVPLPPPPPPPPPLPSPAKVGNQQPRAKPAPNDQPPESAGAFQAAMQAIRGGVSLRAVPPPPERPAGQEKVVDVASELRQRVLKQKKQESQGITSRLSQHQEEIKKMADLLHRYHGTASFIRHLRTLLAQIEDFLRRVEIPEEVLAHKMEWPAQLVDNLREVLENMKVLEGKVVATENLCKKTMENSMQVSGGVPVWKVNPDDVEKCVWDVVRVAKDLNSDESRYFRASQSYPVDTADIQSLLQRAADAVTPLLDKLYEKAFQSHQSVFDPTITKYDLSFRLKNTQRLLALCCKISDALGMYLQVPKHELYSEAQLKSQELKGEFQKAMQVIERQGEWDAEESFDLQRPFTKRASSSDVREDAQLISRVLKAVTTGREVEGALGEVTEQLFPRIEVQLIKAAVASGNIEVIDCVMALRNRCCAEEVDKHKRDFDWLLEAVTKGEQECVKHLVENHSISINYQSGDAANSVLHRCVQRQKLPMFAFLIRQGGNPLLQNTSRRTPLQLLALKCFPPHIYTAKTEEEREPLFSLSSYINNPSLSDVVLISEDGERFFAHRLVMCAQSPVLKTMVDSELWAESKNKEIPLPTISGRVVRTLLQYLYTGRCLFPCDDLNLGLDLMIAADQFLLEPMRLQCERALSDKIDAEVVIPLYHAAFRYSTPKLLANCTNFMLNHYKEVSDPDHEALLHLLENSQQK